MERKKEWLLLGGAEGEEQEITGLDFVDADGHVSRNKFVNYSRNQSHVGSYIAARRITFAENNNSGISRAGDVIQEGVRFCKGSTSQSRYDGE